MIDSIFFLFTKGPTEGENRRVHSGALSLSFIKHYFFRRRLHGDGTYPTRSALTLFRSGRVDQNSQKVVGLRAAHGPHVHELLHPSSLRRIDESLGPLPVHL